MDAIQRQLRLIRFLEDRIEWARNHKNSLTEDQLKVDLILLAEEKRNLEAIEMGEGR